MGLFKAIFWILGSVLFGAKVVSGSFMLPMDRLQAFLVFFSSGLNNLLTSTEHRAWSHDFWPGFIEPLLRLVSASGLVVEFDFSTYKFKKSIRTTLFYFKVLVAVH